MPSVRVSEHTDLAPDVVLRAARDFSARRADLWPDVHVEHLEVHEIGETYAEVTEGNPWPIGHVWERLRYDWTDPNARPRTAAMAILSNRRGGLQRPPALEALPVKD